MFDPDYELSPINPVFFVVHESRVVFGGGELPIFINVLEWSINIVSLVASYLVIGIGEAKVFGFNVLTAHRTVAVIIVEEAVKNPIILVTPPNNNNFIEGSTGRVLAVSF